MCGSGMLILDFNLLWGFLIVLNLLDNRKYEEITPPHVEDFCYITDNTYTREEVNVHLFWFNLYCSYYDFFFISYFSLLVLKVLKMESDILGSLKFEVSNPTTLTFLR